MSLHRRCLPPVPEETARVARAAFRRGNPYLKLRDELGPIFDDADFYSVYGHRGHPATSPALLALVTLLQYMENLPDRQAADAVRGRLDWKYLLGLPLTDEGFDDSILTTFRGRLIGAGKEALIFERLLTELMARGLVEAERQRTDSTYVLAAVYTLNRLELVGETMRHVLDSLATSAPDWLRAHSAADWPDRYGARIAAARLPKATAARERLIAQIGRDGLALLASIDAPDAPDSVRSHEAVRTLRRVWEQQFIEGEDGPRLRTHQEMAPAAEVVRSPYDPDARWSFRRDTEWVGYLVHLTETCNDGAPALITQVQTAAATEPDFQALPAIQADLAARQLVPDEQLVDSGYVNGETIAGSRASGTRLIGPLAPNSWWQARIPGGFGPDLFVIDWEAQHATCPAGKQSSSWRTYRGRGGRPMIQVHFREADCKPCALRQRCTHSERRSLGLQERSRHAALTEARRAQTTAAFKQQHAARAGIEATISQAVRRSGLRQARYRGFAKTRLQHLLTAAAINLARIAAWLAGESRLTSRPSAYARLMAQPASP